MKKIADISRFESLTGDSTVSTFNGWFGFGGGKNANPGEVVRRGLDSLISSVDGLKNLRNKAQAALQATTKGTGFGLADYANPQYRMAQTGVYAEILKVLPVIEQQVKLLKANTASALKQHQSFQPVQRDTLPTYKAQSSYPRSASLRAM